MRLRTLFILSLLGGCAAAQQPGTTAPVAAPGPNPLVTLASEFFEHDFVNFYAYGDGVLDTNNPVVTNTGQVKNSLGTGFDLGGGVSLSHTIRNGQISLSYQGAWRDYQSNYFASGTTQNLSIGFSKRVSRHLSMYMSIGGGIALYGGTFINSAGGNTLTPVITNPLSPETRYVGANLGLTYQQTRRLSYSLFGGYFLSRYNTPGSIGSTGVSGGASANYRLTARDTLSVSYTHSYFTFQRNAGTDYADQVGLGYSREFNNHWSVSLFGGGARSVASGTLALPVTLVLPNGQGIGGYELGSYRQTVFVPSFSGSVSHSFRRSALGLSAGEGIAGSGNGYFIASRSLSVTGFFSYSWHGQNISMAGTSYRLTSIANTVSSAYVGNTFSASYGRSLVRYVGMFLRYDFLHYGALAPLSGVTDNRISFGLSFSSRSVPLTLF